MRDGVNMAAIQLDKDFKKVKKLDQHLLFTCIGPEFFKAKKYASGEISVRRLCQGDEE